MTIREIVESIGHEKEKEGMNRKQRRIAASRDRRKVGEREVKAFIAGVVRRERMKNHEMKIQKKKEERAIRMQKKIDERGAKEIGVIQPHLTRKKSNVTKNHDEERS